MPKIEVTQELCDALRTLRLQNKLQSKDVAKRIEKSPAYLSRLENGNIHYIDYLTLNKLIKIISNSDEINDSVIEALVDTLKLKYTKKEIAKQLWLQNFDTLECQIPIPAELIDDINEAITQNEIDRDYLLARINSNESLEPEELKNSKLSKNIWYQKDDSDQPFQYILIEMSSDELDNYLDKKATSGSYIYVFCIAFYVKKIINYGNTVKLDEDSYNKLYQETSEYLKSFKFMTYSDKAELARTAKSKEELDSLMNTFDEQFYDLTAEIFSGFKYLSMHNIKTTNERLASFKDNMRWDLGFMLKLVDLHYRDLEDTSIDNRKRLLKEIEELIIKYSKLSKSENIETY